MAKHIAFKCNWNDGTQESDAEYPGWSGICSTPQMKLNVLGPKPRRWCSNGSCPCAKAIARKGRLPRAEAVPCYESALFREVSFSAGGRQILGTGPGKLAILTSRRQSWVEADRVIIGAYRIKEIGEQPYFREQDSVVGVKSSMVRMHQDQFLRYWDYARLPSDGVPAWDSGLTRYLDDEEVAAILLAMHEIELDISPLAYDSLLRDFRADDGVSGAQTSSASDAYRDKLLGAERAFFVRNSRAAAIVRRNANGVCEACRSNVIERYGADIIEAHHRRAFATLPANTNIVPETDLAALCPSCHRALHRRSATADPMSVAAFAKAITKMRMKAKVS